MRLSLLALAVWSSVVACGGTIPDDLDNDTVTDFDRPGGDGSTTDEGGPGDSAGGDSSTDDDGPVGDPGVIRSGLVVKSNGNAIGEFFSVDEYTIQVLDRDRDVIFSVNDTTGYVAGPPATYYTGASCTGARYLLFWPGVCPGTATPARRRVYGTSNDGWGFALATSLMIEGGNPEPFTVAALAQAEVCSNAGPVSYCGFELVPTTVIPRSFALPITLEEP